MAVQADMTKAVHDAPTAAPSVETLPEKTRLHSLFVCRSFRF